MDDNPKNYNKIKLKTTFIKKFRKTICIANKNNCYPF